MSDWYGVRDAACPLSTRGGGGGGWERTERDRGIVVRGARRGQRDAARGLERDGEVGVGGDCGARGEANRRPEGRGVSD